MCCVHNATAVPLRSLRRARVVCRASVVILDSTGTQAEFLAVELAQLKLGKQWLSRFVTQVTAEGIERVLV